MTCFFFHNWLTYIWKDKEHYGGHRAVRVCQKCGQKDEYHDPNNMLDTSSREWIDANTGKIWQPTDLIPPTDPSKYNTYTGRNGMPITLVHRGMED